MEHDVPNFPMVLAVAAPAFVLLMAIEWFFVSRKKLAGTYIPKDAFTSLAMGTGQLLSDVLMGFISLAILMWFWQFRLFNWGFGIGAMLACLLLSIGINIWRPIKSAGSGQLIMCITARKNIISQLLFGSRGITISQVSFCSPRL